jgi:xylulokinase
MPVVDELMRAHTFCHVVPGVWYVMGVVLTAGGAFGWFRDLFQGLPGDDLAATLTDEASGIPPGSEGLTFLPYLQGERTPHRDAALRGSFQGLSLAHGRGHLTRAVLEGVCFALADSLDILTALRLAGGDLLLTGKGGSVPLLRQLQAAVYGRPVHTVSREEGPGYGAALLAATGIGAFPDVPTAARATLRRSLARSPGSEEIAVYRPVRQRYLQLAMAAAAFSRIG